MLPDNVASSIGFGGLYMEPDTFNVGLLEDYELGGVALNDASQGLQVKNWKLYLDDTHIMIQPEDGAAINLFDAAQVTEISFAFDQNMRWSVAYMQAGVMKLNWFDSAVPGRVTTTFAGNLRNPKMCLDDKRRSQISVSDMIFAYIKNNTELCYRQQRDRFLVERVLRADVPLGSVLHNVGMNKNLRLQFELK